MPSKEQTIRSSTLRLLGSLRVVLAAVFMAMSMSQKSSLKHYGTELVF